MTAPAPCPQTKDPSSGADAAHPSTGTPPMGSASNLDLEASPAAKDEEPTSWEQRELRMAQLMERQTLALESLASTLQGLLAVQQMPQLLTQTRSLLVIMFDPASTATDAQKAEAGQLLAQTLSLPTEWFTLPAPQGEQAPAPRHLSIVPDDDAQPGVAGAQGG